MNKSLILLLQVVRSEGSIDPLLAVGLEYPQIAQLLTQAKQEGYVLLSNSKLVLSAEGNQLLSESSKQKDIGGGWIRPLEEYRVSRIEKGEIYLPEIAPQV